jgi:hypothetical protein
MYESLDKLPNVRRDEYSNLLVTVSSVRDKGLRGRFEYVMGLASEHFTGLVLCDLLEWLRAGSETAVRWDCTLPELILLIEKWLAANPDAPVQLFNPYFTSYVDWVTLWDERGMKDDIYFRRRCMCGYLLREFDSCYVCGMEWADMTKVILGPRGVGTYNLVLFGASGGAVAAAVWTSRNWLLYPPIGFELNNELHVPSIASTAQEVR